MVEGKKKLYYYNKKEKKASEFRKPSGGRMLIMLDKLVEDSEFLYPFYRFQEEGYAVDVVAPKAKETYAGKHGVPFTSNLSPDRVKIDDYDGLIIPGGRAPDYMRTNRGLVEIVKEAFQKDKIVAAICHGPQMLIEADVLRGRKITCWKSVVTDVKNAGAVFIDEAAVVDGNMVTSRSPSDLPQFCKEIIKLLRNS
jgi:protease I